MNSAGAAIALPGCSKRTVLLNIHCGNAEAGFRCPLYRPAGTASRPTASAIGWCTACCVPAYHTPSPTALHPLHGANSAAVGSLRAGLNVMCLCVVEIGASTLCAPLRCKREPSHAMAPKEAKLMFECHIGRQCRTQASPAYRPNLGLTRFQRPWALPAASGALATLRWRCREGAAVLPLWRCSHERCHHFAAAFASTTTPLSCCCCCTACTP